MTRNAKTVLFVLLAYCLLPSAGTELLAWQQGPSQSAASSNSNGLGFSAALLAALALLAHTQSPPADSGQPRQAALPSLTDVRATSPAETLILNSIHKGRVADLTSLNDRHLKADFIETLLFRTSASAIPTKLISIQGAIIDGQISVPDGSSPVPNNIVFDDCTFRDSVDFIGGRFEQSIEFIESRFQEGLDLSYAQIKGDFVLQGGSTDDMAGLPQITLSRVQIEGQLVLLGVHTQEVAGEATKVKNLIVMLGDSPVHTIVMPQLATNSVTIMPSSDKSQGQIGTLNLEQGNIAGDLWVRGLKVNRIDAKGLHVNGITAFDPGIVITESLDLSNTHHGLLTWRVPSQMNPPANHGRFALKMLGLLRRGVQPDSRPCWPSEISASGLIFDDLQIFSKTGDDFKVVPEDLNVAFLKTARSSESAFNAYEQILRSRGRLSEADDVYAGMREKRRAESWLSSQGNKSHRLSAALFSILDFGQATFLGYGHFPLPPLLWSLGFVLAGAILFRDTSRMERVDRHDSGVVGYSRWWYSLELFLPVVDLGVAKSWRPRQSHRRLRTYVRVHQMAGWILIPVALAALTGAIKSVLSKLAAKLSG